MKSILLKVWECNIWNFNDNYVFVLKKIIGNEVFGVFVFFSYYYREFC